VKGGDKIQMRLKCNYVKNLLSDYLDGVLPENQTFAIFQHLRHCRVCQRELETLKKTNQLLKFYIEKSPPDGYFQRLWPNLKYQVEYRGSCNQLNLRWLITLLILKFKGFKAGFLVSCEELKTALNGQWYKALVKCAIVACFVLISIFIDRTYIRPSHKVVSEFIRDSFYSQDTYNSEFSTQQKRNDNRMPAGLTDFRRKDVFGYQVKDINLNRENISNTLPVLHGKVGAIDINLRPVSFKDGILTLVVNLPEVPKVEGHESLGSNKRPKFESWLANLLTDVTLPTLSIADASGLDNVATGLPVPKADR
jgi:hypothetical protein